jgi:predicted N-acyltransferase
VPLTVKVAQSLSALPAAAWDACAFPGAGDAEDSYNPFVSHAFLSALEESGCVGRRTGWAPLHVVVEDEAGRMLAAAPCYLKSHSMGEYVFDHSWADAYERAGGAYYPKLQVSVPFTPVTGPRLLVANGTGSATARHHLVTGLKALRAQTEASSVHATFLTDPDAASLADENFLIRRDRQFHWFNEGYATFEDFLSALSSRKRKAIRRERRDALANGISIDWLTGTNITEAHWDTFFAFYMDTGSRKWGRPYLNRRFFSLLGERLSERVLLVMAKRNGRYVAGALNLIGESRLYGRNWGCTENHPFLHFEVCYYQAIQFAIKRRLSRVEAGAQGEHKLARGYRPVITTSAHDLADPALRRAVDSYLRQERAYVAEAADALAAATPFRREEQE